MSLARLHLEQELRRAEDLALTERTVPEALVREAALAFARCIGRRLAQGKHALPPYREYLRERLGPHRRKQKYTSEQRGLAPP